MMDLAEAMETAAAKMLARTQQRAQDADFSLRDIDDTLQDLAELQAALECARAQIEEACMAAADQSQRRNTV
jgi:hypothetical protein